MSDLLSHLNAAQRQAASCTEGPVMIIAGAGSGKTSTLTYRIAYLLEQGADPWSILALTFTNKAAAEMKERITKLVGPKAKNLWMGTFHSIFARILRVEASHIGYTSAFTIYDEDDCRKTIDRIVKSLNLDPKIYKSRKVLSRISLAKNNLITPSDYEQNADIRSDDAAARQPEIAEIYKRYQLHLFQSNAMDFDDLLVNMNVLLRDHPDILLKYQERFRYILVDEYQDTNHSQYFIIKKLAARYQNICVVGDDAQSIYSFRGANIENILNFKRDYPDAHIFKLEQNYRSTQTIVKAANSLIEKNKDQIKKTIWTEKPTGSQIEVIRSTDERLEAAAMAQNIKQIFAEGNREYKDFAILYRTNSQSRAIEEQLRRCDIPYHIYQGISFYERKSVKDLLAYFRLVVNNHDTEALLRVINKPARGIGETTLTKIRIAATDNEVSIFTVLENLADFNLGISSRTVETITNFVLMIKEFSSHVRTSDAYSLAERIAYASGLIKALKVDLSDEENKSDLENIEELLNGVQEFCQKEEDITPESGEMTANGTSAPIIRTLDLFLQQVLLLTSEDKEKSDPNQVSLMTIHAAKGLEFPVVFVGGLEENLFPSFLSTSSRKDLEEERRLFYVAITRAEERLFLSYALTRYINGSASAQEPSRFLSDIDTCYLHLPSAKRAFPPAGSLPRPFARKPTPLPHTLSPKHTVQGPTIPNTPAQISAIKVGMTVSHAKYGLGEIIAEEGTGASRIVTVYFQNVGEKKLMLKFAKLSIVQ